MDETLFFLILVPLIGAVLALACVVACLVNRNRQFSSAIDEISGNFSLWDKNEKLVIFNERFKQDLGEASHLAKRGTPFEAYIRERVSKGLLPEAEDAKEQWIADRLDRHKNPGAAFELQLDERRWNLINEQRTKLGGTVIYGVDITDLKAAQTAVAASEQRFRDFASAAADWFWEADENQRFCFVSDNIYRLTGLKAEDLIGKRRDETAAIEDDPELWAKHRNLLENREPFREFTVRRPTTSGGSVWTSISGVPHFTAEGNFSGYRGVGRNVTELVRAREALEQSEAASRANAERAVAARRAAQAADQAKSDFLASMSHEFRTPLNAIMGFGQLLHLDSVIKLSPEHTEFLRLILESGEYLLELVNEILDLAAIESGELRVASKEFDAQAIIQIAVETMQPAADKANIALSYSLHSGPMLLLSDAQRYKQVFLNLISNAIKYNRPGGRVEVAIEPVADAASLRTTVTDTGLGIAQHLHSRIFAPFSRLGAENSNIEGAGIGLALCQRLVKAMGGEIGFESEAGAGFKFWVIFPIDAGRQTSAPDQSDLLEQRRAKRASG